MSKTSKLVLIITVGTVAVFGLLCLAAGLTPIIVMGPKAWWAQFSEEYTATIPVAPVEFRLHEYEVGKYPLDITDVRWKSGLLEDSVVGKVINNGDLRYNSITVTVFTQHPNGELKGIAYDTTTRLAPGETWEFNCSISRPCKVDLSRILIKAD
ncbi:MAG TPA: FxLYD domain-containing protein [bacterium]|nr:FxLYD domain-containing protein [bacterium]